MTVEDTEEVLKVQSPILGPDGRPIIRDIPSQKLGFIGFIKPKETDE